MGLFAILWKYWGIISAFLASLVLVGFGICLVTFCPYDPAWACDDTLLSFCSCGNAAGKMGAHVASLVISLFGGSVWVLFVFAVLTIFYLAGIYTFRYRLDRLVGGLLMLGSCAGLCCCLEFDVFMGVTPGGALGWGICCLLRMFCDSFAEKAVLIFFLWSSFVLSAGCSWLNPLGSHFLPKKFFFWRSGVFGGFLNLIYLYSKKSFGNGNRLHDIQDDSIEKLVEEVLDYGWDVDPSGLSRKVPSGDELDFFMEC